LLLLGGPGLLLGGGGVFGIVDSVGQVALASITDPSGHVFVSAAGGGVNVWVHDGSVGFFVQSAGGGVPVLQLSVHVDPVPFPPDVIVDVLVGGIATDVLPGGGADNVVVLIYGHVVLSLHGGGAIRCTFASLMSQSLVLRFLSRSVMALLSARSHFGSVDLGLSWHLWLVRFKNWPTGQCSPTPDILIVTFVVSCSTTFITVGLLNTKLAGTYTVIATILFPLLSLSTMYVHLKICPDVS
jgi:hypothetical protein